MSLWKYALTKIKGGNDYKQLSTVPYLMVEDHVQQRIFLSVSLRYLETTSAFRYTKIDLKLSELNRDLNITVLVNVPGQTFSKLTIKTLHRGILRTYQTSVTELFLKIFTSLNLSWWRPFSYRNPVHRGFRDERH